MAVFWWGLSLAIVVLAWTVGTESSTSPPFELEDLERENTTDRRRERFSPTRDCHLRVYDADKEMDVIREWHDLVKDPIDEGTALRQLLIEACDEDNIKNPRIMCETFLAAKSANMCVPGLTRAECVAVTMYTMEYNGFYQEFNNASAYGVWAPYRVYTTLLFSAVKKLAAIEPVPIDASLYRGMRVTCSPPNAKRIFWKTFTSTSLNKDVASFFGESTFNEFKTPATIFGARIKNLSAISFEEEVLIPPFEVFDFLKADGQMFYFSASKQQDLLYGRAADLCRSAQTLTTTLTAIVSAAIVALRF